MSSQKLKLSLFVSSTNAGKALSRLYKVLEFHAYTDYELSLVDVLEQPIYAQSLGITQTPTLIMHTQDGDIRLTDDMSDVARVRETFGFKVED